MSVVRSVRAMALLAVLGACGCASPRFVSIGPEGGTIAMPSNASYYRREAFKMLDEKYPNGWEIDHEGEVVVGQVMTNHTTDHEVKSGHEVEHHTEVSDKMEWHIDFHPKGIEPTRRMTRAPQKPTVQPVIQQASYTEQPAKDVRALPTVPVPLLSSDGQAPR